MENKNNFVYIFLLLFYIFLTFFSTINVFSLLELKNELYKKSEYLKNLYLENYFLKCDIDYLKNKDNANYSSKIILLKKDKNEKFIIINENSKKEDVYLFENKNIKNNIYVIFYVTLHITFLIFFLLQNVIALKNKKTFVRSSKELKSNYYKGIL
jgi:hypothetical protein